MSDINKVIETIRKCLALGDSSRNSNENEIANALATAKRLMDQHNLSMAEVAEKPGQKEEILKQRMEERSGAPNWEYDLPFVCNNLFGTEAYCQIGYHRYQKAVVFVGYASDVALAIEVYKLLWLELSEMGRVWSYENPSYELTSKQQLVRRHKYLEGVVRSLRLRSKDHYQGFSKKESNALQVMGDRKAKEVKDWLEDNLNLTTSKRRNTGLHEDAVDAGYMDGKKVSLNFSKAVKSGNGSKPLGIEHKTGG